MAQPSQNRPLSPHLGIYRWQITNTLSILHRLTGFGLALGLIPLTLWLWGAAYDPALFTQLQQAFACPLGLLFLGGWMLAFYYHLGNGLRHLNWDIGYGFTLPEVTSSGILVIVFALSMTAFTWIIIARTVGWL
ncbi:MAG: succinate dehydrogenase, cytochrome b556 subunit [Rickettsiales bacterium]